MIILHRLSLFDHQKLVQPNLDKPSLAPYAVRLSSSPNVCITSARVTLGALELISRHYPNDRSWTLHCVFTAIIVLSIHTWQNADTWQARADLSLLEMASEFSAELFGRAAFPAGFTAVFPKLVEKTRAKVERRGAPSRPATRSGSPVTLHMHDLAQLPLPAPLADNPLPHDQQYAFDQCEWLQRSLPLLALIFCSRRQHSAGTSCPRETTTSPRYGRICWARVACPLRTDLSRSSPRASSTDRRPTSKGSCRRHFVALVSFLPLSRSLSFFL